MIGQMMLVLAQLERPLGVPGNSGFAWWMFVVYALVAIALLLGVVLLIFIPVYGKLWFQAFMSDADVSFMSLVGMGFRQVNPRVIVQAKIMAAQAGLDINRRTGISTARLEAHYLAGGNVMNVIHAIIAAHRANIDLDFDRAAAIDLAGRDVMDAVRTSVHPKVIDCPDPRRSGKTTLSAIAKNGVELRIRARVTVRTNLEQLIGGATEETVIARVGEGIITSIGSSDTHLQVLENPDRISAPCSPAAWTPTRLSRSCRSTSPISTSARTSAPGCRRTRPRRTRGWLAPRPSDAAPKRWPTNRK